MGIPIGRSYTARVSGGTWKSVRCYSCGSEYFYFISRRASGGASSVFFLADDWATTKSQERAHAALVKKLARECDAVPCPDCGLYQREMVALLKKLRFRTTRIIAFTVMLAIVPFSECMRIFDVYRHRDWAFQNSPWQYVLAFAISIWLILLILRVLYNPNLDAISRVGTEIRSQRGPYRRAEFERLMKEASTQEKSEQIGG